MSQLQYSVQLGHDLTIPANLWLKMENLVMDLEITSVIAVLDENPPSPILEPCFLLQALTSIPTRGQRHDEQPKAIKKTTLNLFCTEQVSEQHLQLTHELEQLLQRSTHH